MVPGSYEMLITTPPNDTHYMIDGLLKHTTGKKPNNKFYGQLTIVINGSRQNSMFTKLEKVHYI